MSHIPDISYDQRPETTNPLVEILNAFNSLTVDEIITANYSQEDGPSDETKSVIESLHAVYEDGQIGDLPEEYPSRLAKALLLTGANPYFGDSRFPIFNGFENLGFDGKSNRILNAFILIMRRIEDPDPDKVEALYNAFINLGEMYDQANIGIPGDLIRLRLTRALIAGLDRGSKTSYNIAKILSRMRSDSLNIATYRLRPTYRLNNDFRRFLNRISVALSPDRELMPAELEIIRLRTVIAASDGNLSELMNLMYLYELRCFSGNSYH